MIVIKAHYAGGNKLETVELFRINVILYLDIKILIHNGGIHADEKENY